MSRGMAWLMVTKTARRMNRFILMACESEFESIEFSSIYSKQWSDSLVNEKQLPDILNLEQLICNESNSNPIQIVLFLRKCLLR